MGFFRFYTAVPKEPNYLLTMELQLQTSREAVFGTLTERNGTRLTTLLDNIETFLQHLAEYTKCHLEVVLAYEDAPNTHGHFIILVLPNERAKFEKKFKSWRSWRSWKFKTCLVEEWVSGRRSYEYLEAHDVVLPPRLVCPKAYSRCRKGNCEHQ